MTNNVNGGGVSQTDVVSEDQLMSKMRRLMRMNIKNFCYQDAIFFADKILNLQ